MTPELLNIQHFMACQGRRVRYRPTEVSTALPSIERYTQLERLVDALWAFSKTQGINLGRKPDIILTGEGVSSSQEVLRTLAELEIEVGASALMLGMGEVITTAIFETAKNTPYDPKKVDYPRIISDAYDSEEDEVTD